MGLGGAGSKLNIPKLWRKVKFLFRLFNVADVTIIVIYTELVMPLRIGPPLRTGRYWRWKGSLTVIVEMSTGSTSGPIFFCIGLPRNFTRLYASSRFYSTAPSAASSSQIFLATFYLDSFFVDRQTQIGSVVSLIRALWDRKIRLVFRPSQIVLTYTLKNEC